MAGQLTEPPYDRPRIVPSELEWKALLPLDEAALEQFTKIAARLAPGGGAHRRRLTALGT
jgi:hypothetical protein